MANMLMSVLLCLPMSKPPPPLLSRVLSLPTRKTFVATLDVDLWQKTSMLTAL
jgi:hypothetical protein